MVYHVTFTHRGVTLTGTLDGWYLAGDDPIVVVDVPDQMLREGVAAAGGVR